MYTYLTPLNPPSLLGYASSVNRVTPPTSSMSRVQLTTTTSPLQFILSLFVPLPTVCGVRVGVPSQVYAFPLTLVRGQGFFF